MGFSSNSAGMITADPTYYLALPVSAAEFLAAPDYFARFIVMKDSMSIPVASTS